jgi:uncharacterized protein (TIGR00255 family)
MTGFAEVQGSDGRYAWRWEARGVNGRGLELRLRLPEGCEALDPVVRACAARRLARGSVTIGLRLARADGPAPLAIDAAALAAALAAVARIEAAAAAAGVPVQPATADRLMGLPGVLVQQEAGELLSEARLAAFRADLDTLLDRFAASRGAEGAALARALAGQLDQIEALGGEARATAEARAARAGTLLRERVAALLGGGAPVEEARLAQELALLAVRADVTEELHRLAAHVAAARALLAQAGPVGRKLDFLSQEFNREANTLCAKANSVELTRIGLALKAVIDQFREQVQNVE